VTLTPEQQATAEARSRTMSLRALRRLSEAEVPSLGVALSALGHTEAILVEVLGDLRRTAERETRGRRSRGETAPGPCSEGYQAARRLLVAVTDAREELFTQV